MREFTLEDGAVIRKCFLAPREPVIHTTFTVERPPPFGIKVGPRFALIALGTAVATFLVCVAFGFWINR